MSEIAQPEALPVPDVTAGWGTDTFALKHPFSFANVVYSGLTLRVPTGPTWRLF